MIKNQYRALYIHGFNSAGYGDKTEMLKSFFGPAHVFSLNLPWQPAAALAQLDFLVSLMKQQRLILFGTSLGGFYAAWLAWRHRLPAVLINPAMEADQTLLRLAGQKQINYKTGEEYVFTQQDCAELGRVALSPEQLQEIKDLLYLYLDAEDELLDSAATAEKFRGFRVKVFTGGNHRFAHMGELLADLQKQLAMGESAG